MLVELLLSAASFAQDCPAPFTETDLNAMLADSQAALDKDDALAHVRIWKQLAVKVPCLQNQLPKNTWAELLVDEALVRHTQDGADWMAPLSTALAIWPDVPGVPDWALQSWTPPPPRRPLGTPIPEGTVLFVDGVLTQRPTTLEGPHIVQRLRESHFDSVFLDGQQIPTDWFEVPASATAPTPAPVAPAGPTGPVPSRGFGALILGVGNEGMGVQPSGQYLATGRKTGFLSGLMSAGTYPLAGVAALGWDLEIPMVEPSVDTEPIEGGFVTNGKPTVQPDLYAGFAIALPTASITLGGGLTRARWTEGLEPVSAWFPQPHVGVDVFGGRGDVGILGGATPSAAHVDLRGGYLVAWTGPVAWRVAADFDFLAAWLVESKGDRTATATRERFGATIGTAWGRSKP